MSDDPRTYVTASILTFDEGEQEAMLLHRGSRESCIALADALPAVAYSGPRRVVSAEIVVVPASDDAEASR